MNKNIFISYSWSDAKIADQIEKDFSRLQINLRRDVRDLSYKSSISDFMESIRESDFAILLISDSYLRSKNCMREVLHLLKDRNYEEKILPVIVKGTKIYSASDRLSYTKYWIEEKDSLNEIINTLPATSILQEIAELKIVETITSSINEFLTYISDKKNLTFEELKAERYSSILNCMGGLNITHLVKLLNISLLEDIDEREVFLDQWFEEYEPTSEAYSVRASIASERGNIKKAEVNYQKSLEVNEDNAFALNNYGFLLYRNNKEHDKAKELFEKAIEIMPTLTEARLNLGVLLTDHFEDWEGAKKQYETIISYDPAEPKAYANLTNYYKQDKGSRPNRFKIAELYEKALELNPDYLEAHIAFGSHLSEYLGEHEKAAIHYDEILRIDPRLNELVTALKQRIESIRNRRDEQQKQGRNELCNCGSGKKYKKCHGI